MASATNPMTCPTTVAAASAANPRTAPRIPWPPLTAASAHPERGPAPAVGDDDDPEHAPADGGQRVTQLARRPVAGDPGPGRGDDEQVVGNQASELEREQRGGQEQDDTGIPGQPQQTLRRRGGGPGR